MKARVTITPIIDERWEEDILARLILDVQIEKDNKKICILDGNFVSIPNAKEYSINVRESGQDYNDYFEVFTSAQCGCTIKVKKPKTKVYVEREWTE